MTMTVLIPTFNESGNVAELVQRVSAVADESDVHEILFVDDSTDDTPSVIAELTLSSDLPVRLIHRCADERTGGLSGAVVTGLRAATGDWVLVMDGDLQHPPEDLPRISGARTDVDMVVASRYRSGGDAGGLATPGRRLVSTAATGLARRTFPDQLSACTDPMTGFFAVRRSAVDVDGLRPQGFKILLEILARHRLRVAEVPFAFADRTSGQSKATWSQGASFLRQLVHLRVAARRAARAVRAPDTPSAWSQRLRFGSVGAINFVVDVGLFNLLLLAIDKPLTAKLVASSTAVASSYVLNRRWTWRHRSGPGSAGSIAAFAAVALLGVGVSEACLLTSHYLLGLQTALADNISANVIGLGLSMVVRYRLCDRWVFVAADGR